MSIETTPTKRMLDEAQLEQMLSAEMKSKLTEMADREVAAFCDYASSRATVKECVDKELDTLQKGMEQVSALGEQISEKFKNELAGNSVYAGTYDNQIEQKDDAIQALEFAKTCIETKEQIAGGFAQYGMAALPRTLLPSQWKKPTDPALKQKINTEAQAISYTQKSKGGIGYFLSILAGILFIFVPLLFKSTMSEAASDWFYSTVESDIPNVVGVSVAIAIIGCIITAVIKFSKKLFLAECAIQYAERYYTKSKSFAEAEKAYDELQEYYDGKSKMLKELSDAYSNASNTVMGEVINNRFLAPFPADYMNKTVIEYAIKLLKDGAASTLKDVYSIFEQILQEQARKEAAQRAAQELLAAEKARLAAQQAQQTQPAATQEEKSEDKPQEPVDNRNYKTVVLEGVRHGKLNDTSTATYITDTQTGREYRIYHYHKNTGYFEDENSNIYYFNESRDFDNVAYSGKYRRYEQSEWDADSK